VSRNERERLRDIKDAIVAIHGHLSLAREQEEARDDALLHDAPLPVRRHRGSREEPGARDTGV
jgi:hypothetical protein